MSSTQSQLRSILVFAALTLLLSACTQSLSSAPAKTPTIVATSIFVSPVPSAQNPMDAIATNAALTAAVQTSQAGEGANLLTPQAPTAETTPSVEIVVTPGAAGATPTNALAAPTSGGAPNPTPVPSGVRPATYTLQTGEFPYCIARRFNVDPDQLLSMNGLTSPDVYYAGLALKIPQSGSFPGDRALRPHPSTYTVASADETLYSIACKYGDVDPAAIASANGISVATKLTVGQQIQIP